MIFGAVDHAVEDSSGTSAPVAAHKQVVLPANGNASQFALGGVVVDIEVAIFDVSDQGLPLVEGVLDGVADGTLGQDVPVLRVELFFHLSEDRFRPFLTQGAALFGVEVFGIALDVV